MARALSSGLHHQDWNLRTLQHALGYGAERMLDDTGRSMPPDDDQARTELGGKGNDSRCGIAHPHHFSK